jgi:hypothetical protein
MVQLAPAPSIAVTGNVEGSIVSGERNFVVNTNHGTIVYNQVSSQVMLRQYVPRPPRAPRGFVGRSRELANLSQSIANREPVLLQGDGGIGKTTLLKQAANLEVALAQPNGVVYLEGVDQAGAALEWDDLLQFLFDALFESNPPLKVSLASARTYLSNTISLVLLDRLNLPLDALENLVDLFPQAPLLVVSDLPFSGDAYELVRLGVISLPDAAQMLAARAGILPEEVDQDLLDKTCTMLGRVPLALTTVGNVIRENSLLLEDVYRTLEAIQPQIKQPIQAAIERSFRFAHSYLSEDEFQIIALAAAAPAVSAGRPWLETYPGGQAACQKLERLGLLQANSPRLRLHPEYAPFALEGVDMNAIKVQLLGYLKTMLKDRALDFEFIKDELGNLLGLLDWAAVQGRWQDVITLGRVIDPYLTLRGLWNAWGDVLGEVLSAARAVDDQAVEAWALHQLGTRQIGAGQIDQAIDLLRQALDLRRELGDAAGMSFSQHNLDTITPPRPPGPAGGLKAQPRRLCFSTIGLILVILFSFSVPMIAWAVSPGKPDVPRVLGGLRDRAIPIVQMISPPKPPMLGEATLIPNTERTSPLTPSPAPSLSPTFTFTPDVTATQTPTPSPSTTATQTQTPTVSQTPTETPTPTITLTPTFSFPVATVLNQSTCRYGPGTAYLYSDGLYPGDQVEVHGRNYNSTWLFVKNEKSGRYCWVSSTLVEVQGNVETVAVTQPSLPKSDQAQNPTNVQATRNGSTVTITWDQVHIFLRDARGYLLDVRVCRNSQYVQLIVQTDATSYDFTDEKGCSSPSGGVIYSVDVRGYSDAVKIPWP